MYSVENFPFLFFLSHLFITPSHLQLLSISVGINFFHSGIINCSDSPSGVEWASTLELVKDREIVDTVYRTDCGRAVWQPNVCGHDYEINTVLLFFSAYKIVNKLYNSSFKKLIDVTSWEPLSWCSAVTSCTRCIG